MLKLTQFSKGAGCGCKIAPAVLEEILKHTKPGLKDVNLLVGNETRDDAAVYDIGNGKALISTTDFFTPIVDDPYDFGAIAAANAISDVYAMGGNPIMAIAILGWPVDKLPPEMAARVLDGAREVSAKAGIVIAGGHSIDSPEPFFGLSVNGMVDKKNIKTNRGAGEGDFLFLSKPLGTGILGTAMKRGKINDEDYKSLLKITTSLNRAGALLGELPGVNAMTDITGFGLLGHLSEMASASGMSVTLNYNDVSLIEGVTGYISSFCFPDNLYRNWNSFEKTTEGIGDQSFFTLNDPQTNGGLLVSVSPEGISDFREAIKEFDEFGCFSRSIGRFTEPKDKLVRIV